ncbi:heparinase II/III family protein [Nitrincola nitratireducens]|uniref:Uncharacterized protein n=1 Tax=Nitrincola nitratireducens TaxID=1229521 RepID=W9V399_9GAMM|nr:heparinase II/III family protein [Nitrincola nitratireducens]EXJ10632.1 hypothetical protein D791_02463 [Nitrincola nitratireducens]
MNLRKLEDAELKLCIQDKLQLFSNQSTNKDLGEKLVVNKQLELAPFKAVKFQGWCNWEQNPLNNRSWQWRLNWLSFLSYLMAYHRASGDEAVLDSAREAIQSWLDTYLETDTSYPFEFIWHDHATALRAEQLIFFLYYCRESASEWANRHAGFLIYIEQALLVHGQWLAKDSFYSEHTNHGLEQARVLLLLGTVYDGEQAQQWQQIAIQRIKSELEFAFTFEGVHVENSPAYHIFVFKVFLGIIKDYPEEVLGDLAEQFNQFSAKALSFVTNILRPDGRLPPIGDTEQLPTSDAYKEMFGHRLEYQYFLYSLTQGKQGVKPPILNKVYPRSGYAIFRNEWPAKEHYQKAFHLIVKVGCSSRYHHQQDEGHISLYAGGEDWLIDSGLYNYINNDPVRKYMRGRPGHNVPIISHASYSKEFEHRLSAWKVSEFSESDTKPNIKMQLDVLTPVFHERNVTFDSQNKLVEVQDKILADDEQSRNITLQWHFPKDKTLSINNNQVLVTSDTGNQLAIEFEGDTPDDLSVVSGRKEDRVFSCISYKANQVEPSQLLRVVFKERNQLNVTTRFHFDMADMYTIPLQVHDQIPLYSLEQLLGATNNDEPILTSVLLGDSPACLALAKVHRNQGIGHLQLIVNEKKSCDHILKILETNYLTTWVKCHVVQISKQPPITIDKKVLSGVEGVGRLVVTDSGFNEKNLTTVLLTMLPMLVKRMTKSGEVWISVELSDQLKSLCAALAKNRGLKVFFFYGVSGF